MRLIVNAEVCEVEECDSVATLLQRLGVDPVRVAVLVNQSVVPGAQRETYRLQEEDRVELVTFLAGG